MELALESTTLGSPPRLQNWMQEFRESSAALSGTPKCACSNHPWLGKIDRGFQQSRVCALAKSAESTRGLLQRDSYNRQSQTYKPSEDLATRSPREGLRMPENGPGNQTRWRRGFWSLIATQFQGAFNDYGLRNLTIFLIMTHAFAQTAAGDSGTRDQLVFYVQSLFAIPFILFSMTGGYFADRYSKRSVIIGLKFFELAVMILAAVGLAAMNLYLVLGAIFLVSTQAALFGPSKYGSLPELLPPEKLSWGNGVIELGTFLALIAGSVAGAYLVKIYAGRMGHAGFLLLGFTVVGLLCSLGISRVPPADASRNFRLNLFGDLWAQTKIIRRDRVLWLAVVGNTYFWFLGALLQVNIILYGGDVLRVDETHA